MADSAARCQPVRVPLGSRQWVPCSSLRSGTYRGIAGMLPRHAPREEFHMWGRGACVAHSFLPHFHTFPPRLLYDTDETVASPFPIPEPLPSPNSPLNNLRNLSLKRPPTPTKIKFLGNFHSTPDYNLPMLSMA